MYRSLLAGAVALSLFLCNPESNAQTLSWVRGALVIDFGQSRGIDIAVDAAGHVYSVGTIGGNADLDGDGVADVASEYESPVIIRYDADGGLVWRRVIAANPSGNARGIALDGQGGFYVTGDLFGTADFDGDGVIDVRTGQNVYVFIAHYNSDGTFDWVRATCGVRGTAVAADPSDGSVVATGWASHCTDFNRDGRADDDMPRGVYTVKYDVRGNLIWSRFPRNEAGDGGNAIVLDADGNAYVGGTTEGTADFSGNGSVDLTAPLYVAKYDSEGTFQWVRGIAPSEFSDGVKGLAVAGNNLYVAGAIAGPTDFSGDGVVDLTTSGSVGDLFVARYNTLDGAYVWARGAGGGAGSLSIAYDLAADDSGVYATGFLSGRVDFDGDRLPELQRGLAMFVAHYLADGTFTKVWAPTAPNTFQGGTSEGLGLAIGPEGHFHVAGVFTSDVDFTGDGNTDLTTPSFSWFTARYSPISTSASHPETLGGLALHVHPVPFGDVASIQVESPASARVRVEVFDVLGRSVALLHDGPAPGAPLHFDGRGLAAGTYILYATTGSTRAVRLITRMPGLQ